MGPEPGRYNTFRRSTIANGPSCGESNPSDNDNDNDGLEWGGRDLSTRSLLNWWDPAQHAGCVINTCESTGGH